ncbi:MAG TPA: nucleotidyltransferase [Pyrinomonadaceae bacterium]|nr:nucleotidyltransferase [Pyrinomonadaceae bacterium]
MTIDLSDPTTVLIEASRALERAGLQSAAFGGLALAMYGQPRETKDADLAVTDIELASAESAFRDAALNVLRAFDRVTFGGLFVSRLTLIGGIAGSLNTVDLVEPRSSRYASEVLVRALDTSLRNQPLRVVSPEDFVILKVLATRDRDLEDARTILSALAAQLDFELIEHELQRLAGEISDYDFLSRWHKVRSTSPKN